MAQVSFHDMEDLDSYIQIDHDHNTEVRKNWWNPRHFDGPSALTTNDDFNPDNWAKEAA